MSMFPLARTPLDEKGGRAVADYTKRLKKVLDSLTPWEEGKTVGNVNLANLRGKIQSGNVVVILDAMDDPNSQLYKGVQVLKG